tara:strand:- start:11490 stop:11960 length:471 start_codon:yes stop_codon:yes gene_type:complete
VLDICVKPVILIGMIKQDSRYKIDFNKKVFVYRNLHKNCWSVRQNGLVKLHALELQLYSCAIKVSRVGQARVRKEKRKNVHAGISGFLEPYCTGIFVELSKEVSMLQQVWKDLPDSQMREITYNPYKYDSFVHKDDESPRWFGCTAKLEEKRVLIA